MREQEVNTDILNLERSSIEGDLNGLKLASASIERLALKLDSDDPYKFLRIYTRVGVIKERILGRTIPYLQSELERVNQSMESAREAVVDEAAAKLLARLERDIIEATLQGVLLSKTTQGLVDYMKISLREGRSIPQEELEDGVLGGLTFKRSRRNVLNDRLHNARSVLRDIGWDIVDTRAKKGNFPGEYRLEPIRREEGIAASPEPAPTTQEIEVVAEKPLDLLTQEEAAVIAALLTKSKNMLTKHGFEDPHKELAEKLGLGVELKLDKIELNRLRIQALEHLRKILSSDQIEEIYDNHNPDIQSLFVYFVDREKALDLLEELLNVDIELSWHISKGGEVVDIIPLFVPKRPKEIFRSQGPLFEVKEIPLVLEERTPLESGVLRVIVDQLSKNKKLSFLELQGVMYRLAVEVDLADRFRSFERRHQFKVFQPEEIKKSFSEAFRKIRLPGGAKEVEDGRLLADLSSVMKDVSGGDAHRFQRAIGGLIDNMERDFYRAYQPASGEKVIWLDIDSIGA